MLFFPDGFYSYMVSLMDFNTSERRFNETVSPDVLRIYPIHLHHQLRPTG